MTLNASFPITLEQSLLLRDLLIYYISSLDIKVQEGIPTPYFSNRIDSTELLKKTISIINEYRLDEEILKEYENPNHPEYMDTPEYKKIMYPSPDPQVLSAMDNAIDIHQKGIAPLITDLPDFTEELLLTPSFGLLSILSQHESTTITTLQSLLSTLNVIPFSNYTPLSN